MSQGKSKGKTPEAKAREKVEQTKKKAMKIAIMFFSIASAFVLIGTAMYFIALDDQEAVPPILGIDWSYNDQSYYLNYTWTQTGSYTAVAYHGGTPESMERVLIQYLNVTEIPTYREMDVCYSVLDGMFPNVTFEQGAFKIVLTNLDNGIQEEVWIWGKYL